MTRWHHKLGLNKHQKTVGNENGWQDCLIKYVPSIFFMVGDSFPFFWVDFFWVRSKTVKIYKIPQQESQPLFFESRDRCMKEIPCSSRSRATDASPRGPRVDAPERDRALAAMPAFLSQMPAPGPSPTVAEGFATKESAQKKHGYRRTDPNRSSCKIDMTLGDVHLSPTKDKLPSGHWVRPIPSG